MSGLFRRARALRTRMVLLGELQDDDFVLDIPDDEKMNVLSGIDSMLKDDRIRMDEGAMRYIPKKRSFVLPLVLNIGAVLLLGVGALVLWQIFDRSESALVHPDVGLESAEGRILERLRENAEAELGLKNLEISNIRNLLADLENQKSFLAVETESKLAERENELRKEFDTELAAERARLSESGVIGDELTAALTAYEADVRNRFEADLSEARTVAAAEQERQLAELDAQRGLYESQIAAADEERNRLQGELDSRNAELEEVSEATMQLNELRNLQEQERNVTAQILAFYAGVGSARSAGDTESALNILDSLEQYLLEDGIRSLDAVESRRDIDTFLTDAIRRLVVLESSGFEAAPLEDNETAETLAALAAGSVAGTQLFDAGEIEAAREVWRDAFSAMPELEEAFDSALAGVAGGALSGVTVLTAAQLTSARDEGLAEGLRIGREAAQADINTDLDNIRKEGYAEGLETGLDESTAQIEDLKSLLASISARIENLQIRYRTALHRNSDDERESRDRLLSLLDTKLVIKSGLDPSLHDSFETYTDTGGELKELEGREAVYAEILTFLKELASISGE